MQGGNEPKDGTHGARYPTAANTRGGASGARGAQHRRPQTHGIEAAVPRCTARTSSKQNGPRARCLPGAQHPAAQPQTLGPIPAPLRRAVHPQRLFLAAHGGSRHHDPLNALLGGQIEHRLLKQLLADGA